MSYYVHQARQLKEPRGKNLVEVNENLFSIKFFSQISEFRHLRHYERKESEGPNPIVIGQIFVFKLILVLFLLFSVLYRAVALVVIIFKHFQHELWKKSLRTFVISKKRPV